MYLKKGLIALAAFVVTVLLIILNLIVNPATIKQWSLVRRSTSRPPVVWVSLSTSPERC
jgi:hypothetical protein